MNNFDATLTTLDFNGAHIELTHIGGDEFPNLYAYTVLYKGQRTSGNADLPAHVMDDDELVTASILTHAGHADENVIEMTMNQLRKALEASDDPNILGKLALGM